MRMHINRNLQHLTATQRTR